MTASLRLLWVVVLVSFLALPTVRAADKGSSELTPAADAAIKKGLDWLASHQNADGSWGHSHHVANTALSLMAFMVQGHFPEKPPYGAPMAKGIEYLLKEAKDNSGYLGSNMYEHGLGTLALSEAWGMSSRSEKIRDALKQAVGVIVKSQSPKGGWRYQPEPTDQDVSVTVLQTVALASAREAGIVVPNATIDKAVSYVKSMRTADGGFGYQNKGDKSGFARSAAGVTALMMCGERNSREVQDGLEYLRKAPASKFDKLPDNSAWYYYGHYYANQAMYLSGDKAYREWYPQLREALLRKQKTDGTWQGEEYGTPMAIIMLGVPYRFLPIYQR